MSFLLSPRKAHTALMAGVFLLFFGSQARAQISAPVSISTAKLAEGSNFLSVNVTIKNTGMDTLRDLKYVWFMDWSDHKGNLVPELDWTDISGVTESVKLRDDYVAEATYALNGLASGAGKAPPHPLPHG